MMLWSEQSENVSKTLNDYSPFPSFLGHTKMKENNRFRLEVALFLVDQSTQCYVT